MTYPQRHQKWEHDESSPSKLANYFVQPDDYARLIERTIPREFPIAIEEKADILKLANSPSAGDCDVTSVLAHVVPHKVSCTIQNTPCAAIWGFRLKGFGVRSYIASQGGLIQFQGDETASTFSKDGKPLIRGTSIFLDKVVFHLESGRTVEFEAPNSRPDWNSAWQKPSTIPVTGGRINPRYPDFATLQGQSVISVEFNA